MTQKDAQRMLQRRAKAAGIKTKIGNHSLRATGITDYLKSEGASLSEARKMANHADTRTTQLYDRRADVASLDEYNRVGSKGGFLYKSLCSWWYIRRYAK